MSPRVKRLKLKQIFKAIITTSLVLASLEVGISPLKAQEEDAEPAPLTTTIVGEPQPDQAITTKDPAIPVDQLKFLVQPLLLEELETEAAAWLMLLKTKVQEKTDAEIAIKKRNEITDTGQEAVKLIEEAEKLLKEAETAQNNAESGTPEYEQALEKVEEAQQALDEAKASVGDVVEAKEELLEDESAQEAIENAEEIIEEKEAEDAGESGETPPPADNATEASEADEESLETIDTANEALENVSEGDGEALGGIAEDLEKSAAEETELKQELVKGVTVLQEEQTAISDRLEVVLDEMELKGGDATSYRTYIKAVNTLGIDVTDTSGLGVRIQGWLTSEEGGLRWAKNLAIFLLVFGVSVAVTQALATTLDKSLKKFGNVSNLMRDFSVTTVKRGGIVVGILLALTALEVSLGPVLAVLGGVSFIFAFALQSNLGNFASGIMILVTKPFDVGDEVKIAGVWGYIDSINLANTKIRSWKKQMVTLPNNTVWGGMIENYTAGDIRGWALEVFFPVGEDPQIVKDMWAEVAGSNPLVLENPGPWAFIWSYEPNAISVYCSFNTKNEDFWTAYEELIMAFQRKMQEKGLHFAIPATFEIQRDYDDFVSEITSGKANSSTSKEINPSDG